MRIRRRRFLPVVVVVWIASATGTHTQQSTALRGQTFESLKDLPALTGIWGGAPQARGGGPGGARGGNARQGGPPNADQLLNDMPPLKDQRMLARYKEAITLLVSGADNVELAAKYGDVLGGRGGGSGAWRDLGGGLCDPAGGNGVFSGRTGGGPETLMEVLFTPGRVTITTDHGLIRRIYTDGRPLPSEPFVTATGSSIGHWDGDVLVVDTVGLSPRLKLAGVPAGEGFRIQERIYLDPRQLLHIDGVITAPEALTGPYRYTQTYGRFENQQYALAQFVTDCDKDDRSIDRNTNTQRFDLTPPKDLPPPPRN